MACLTALAEHAHSTLKQFSPQNISNTAWAMATLQFKHLVSQHSLCKTYKSLSMSDSGREEKRDRETTSSQGTHG